ncbi:SUKH-3 domain-containing protein [Streptomyces sp. t39]|uniref:SUKH-3 domain-containing protein n=1 Tax=Streptomyces sp. t39 TaxID=1828156 RepID=UPI0011CD43FF|nr:SUKH-3 domain-containing protein [Streptomyces sp. t39]TXS51450.1 hypothetical protein EAO77_26680 [Streptomyces sp. t39]
MTTHTDALTAAGWYEGRDAGASALSAALTAAAVLPSVTGARGWTLFPAARQALREFHGLTLVPGTAGTEVAATGCVVDPSEALHAVRALAALGEELGEDVFPLGRTDADGALGVSESGGLLCVDHGGRWVLGDSVADGLRALTTGRAPRRVVPRRWVWEAPATHEDALENAVRTALAGVYVLHHRQLYGARKLGLTATSLRGIGAEVLSGSVPLPAGSLQEIATPLTAGMRELLDAGGVPVQGCALTLTASAPRGTGAPYSSVRCSVRVGHSAVAPAAAELSLLAGPGTVHGRADGLVRACVRDLTRYTGAQTAAGAAHAPA